MLYRKAQKEIKNWLSSTSKEALLVTGARQVGKTYLILETLKESKLEYIYFDLVNSSELNKTLSNYLDNVDMFIETLFLYNGFVPKEGSIIFLDEIQELKEIVTLIKYLVLNTKYKFIFSGSLLGVTLNSVKSAPVGYLKTITMYPLDLEEFLIANKIDQSVLTKLEDYFLNPRQLPEVIHNTLLNLFYHYLIVGGMPRVVDIYVSTKGLNETFSTLENIIEEYKRDFTKYQKEEKLKLINIFDSIPSELNEKNRRFNINSLGTNSSYRRYEDSFNWLIDAGVAIPTYNIKEIKYPLKASEKRNLFKLFLNDTGLLSSMYGKDTIFTILERKENRNLGALFENFVAMELKSKNLPLYYFNNKKHGEIDFVTTLGDKIIPIEVKSGKDYKNHFALNYFLSEKSFDKAFVLNTSNISVVENIYYYPIYMVMFIKPKNLPEDIEVDLSSLKSTKW